MRASSFPLDTAGAAASFPSRAQSRSDKWDVPAIEKIVPVIIKRYDERLGHERDEFDRRRPPFPADTTPISPNITAHLFARRRARSNLIVLLPGQRCSGIVFLRPAGS